MKTLIKCVLLCTAALLSACASFGSIQPGQSAADVEKLVGAPTEKRSDTSGGQTWEYSLLPEGRKIWFVTFGTDGKVRQVRQTLTEENFRNIHHGQSSHEDILRLLGRPYSRTLFPRLGEEVWEYQFYSDSWRMLLHVYFPAAGGAVKRYSTMLDRIYYRSRR